MIGYLKVPAGRMGNRLFAYHFIRQIAERGKIDYFMPEFPDSPDFLDMCGRNRIRAFIKKKVSFSSICNELANDSVRLVSKILDISKEGYAVEIDRPVLGEFFYDYTFSDPRKFIRVKNQCLLSFTYDGGHPEYIIAAHFRGTDYAKWNPSAVLPKSYYIEAIEHAISHSKTQPVIVLFTDDRTLDAYIATYGHFYKKQKILIPVNKISHMRDFMTMMHADVLVSSPSTFSIWAGILGKKKTIVHSRSWVHQRADANDLFWQRLLHGGNEYYSCEFYD